MVLVLTSASACLPCWFSDWRWVVGSQKLKRGLEKLKHVTREVFAARDDPTELTSLKKVWGLQDDDEQLRMAAATSPLQR